MRGFLIGMLAACALAAPAATIGQSPQTQSSRPPWDGRLMEPERVTEGVWYKRQPPRIWSPVIGNVGLIEQSDGVVVIDTGGSIPDGRDIVAEVAKLTPKPIKAVAITHWHNDHPLGVPGILERYPEARVIATEFTARMLKEVVSKNVGLGKNDPELDRKRIENFGTTQKQYEANATDAALSEDERRQFSLEAKYIPQRLKRQLGNYIALPTETFESELVIDDPVAPVRLVHLGRANTAGDLVAWLPKQRVLFTGDAVVAPSPYGINASIKSWIPALERLKSLEIRHLVPGHGAVQGDASYLDTMIWSMRDVAEQVGKAVAAGKTADQAMEGFDQTRQAARFGADTPWARRWLARYWLEPMVASAWREAKGEEIVEGR